MVLFQLFLVGDAVQCVVGRQPRSGEDGGGDVEGGERVVSDVVIRNKTALVISFMPVATACGSGGESIFHQMNVCTGGRTNQIVFDINGDGVINDNDLVDIGPEGSPNMVGATGLKVEGRLQMPAILRREGAEINYLSSSKTPVPVPLTTKGMKFGITYWMIVDD